MVKTILVPTDGSDGAERAISFAADLASKYRADLILLHVISDPGTERLPDELRELARLENVRLTERDLQRAGANDLLQHARARAEDHGAATIETVIDQGEPARRILDCADGRNADMIVMGSRGLSDLQGLLMGSVSHKVSHLAKCTCVTVR